MNASLKLYKFFKKDDKVLSGLDAMQKKYTWNLFFLVWKIDNLKGVSV